MSGGAVSSTFSWLDYGVLVLVLLLSSLVGVYFGCFGAKIKSMAEFLNGDRKLKTIPIAISLIASQLTGVLIISVPGEIYVHGAIYSLTVVSIILAVLVINHSILPVFYENNIINCYEYLELRFDKRLRTLQTIMFIIAVLLLLPVTLFLPALVFSEVTGTNVHAINAVLSGVCVFYTMIGGVRAVVWTDVVQAFVMVMSSLVVVVIGIKHVGNFWYVIHLAIEGGRFELFDTTLDLSTRHTVWNILIGYTILGISYTALNPSSMNRIMSLPTIKQAKRALSIFAVGNFVVVLLNCLTGLVIYAKYYGCDPLLSNKVEKADHLVPYFIKEVVSHIPGLTGLFVACVFSAGLSTMSANLNSMAGVIYEDCVRPRIANHNDQTANLVMRVTIVIFGLYCFAMGFVMESFGSILLLVLVVLSAANGTTLGMYFLGLYWPKANRTGAFWASIVSYVSVATLVIYSRISIAKSGIVTKLPQTIEKCPNYEDLVGFNGTTSEEVEDLFEDEVKETMKPLNIAIPWFAVMGFLIVWIVGVTVSYTTRHKDPPKYKSTLISKISRKFVPQHILDIEMKVLEENKTLLVH